MQGKILMLESSAFLQGISSVYTLGINLYLPLPRYKRSYVDAIVYLHRSSRKVITRPPDPRSVVTKFQVLCGSDWRSHTILVVTGGTADTAPLQGALQAIYFSGMKVAPFTVSDQGGGNAWDVLNRVITVVK